MGVQSSPWEPCVLSRLVPPENMAALFLALLLKRASVFVIHSKEAEILEIDLKQECIGREE